MKKFKIRLIGPYPAEFAVRHTMFCYPSIFPTRNHVLDHWFLVIGNGHVWHKGGIAEEDLDGHYGLGDTIAKMMRAKKSDAEIWEFVREQKRLSHDYKSYKSMRKRLVAMGVDPKKVTSFCDPPIPPVPTPLDHTYPMCEYSLLTTIPKNIKPDWFVLWREAVILASLLPPHSKTDPGISEERRMAAWAENRKWVEKAQWRAAKLGLADKMSKLIPEKELEEKR